MTVPRQSGGDKTYNFYFSGYRNVEENPEGHQLIYSFDHKGKSITTTFTYTDLGRVETKTDPFGRVTTYTYYDDGNLHTVLDRNGDTTTSTYTPTGKIDTVSYQDGSSVHFTYDQYDRLQTMVDSLGTTTYTCVICLKIR